MIERGNFEALPFEPKNFGHDYMDGTIYFVSNGEHIKIGHSGAPRMRLKALQLNSPTELTMLGSITGTQRDEKALHEFFPDDRRYGEWFQPSAGLIALISEYAETTPAFEGFLAEQPDPVHGAQARLRAWARIRPPELQRVAKVLELQMLIAAKIDSPAVRKVVEMTASRLG